MKQNYGKLILLILSNQAIASNMGNGPAMISTWIFGGGIALFVSLFIATEKDTENEDKESFNTSKFLVIFLGSLFLVFILGLFVAFGEFL